MTTNDDHDTISTPATPSSNFFVMDTGATMSIQTAVTMGLIYRGATPGTIFTSNRELTAEAAIAAGIIGTDAAAYIASLPGSNVPAAHTRIDMMEEETEEVTVSPTEATMKALAEFFMAPSADSKEAALESIEGYLKASL